MFTPLELAATLAPVLITGVGAGWRIARYSGRAAERFRDIERRLTRLERFRNIERRLRRLERHDKYARRDEQHE